MAQFLPFGPAGATRPIAQRAHYFLLTLTVAILLAARVASAEAPVPIPVVATETQTRRSHRGDVQPDARAKFQSASSAARATPREERIYKCLDRTGAVSYQGAPCARAAREAWSTPIERESVADIARAKRALAETLQAAKTAAPIARRSPSRRAASYSTRPRKLAISRCESAQQNAALERDRDWNRIKFDRLRELDEWVRKMCAEG